MRREGGSCGVSNKLWDLTPYLTYVQDALRVDKIDQPRVTCERSAPLVRCYLAGWGLPALAAGITAAATLPPSSNLGSATPLGNGANKPLNHSFADFSYYFSRHLGNGAKNHWTTHSPIFLYIIFPANLEMAPKLLDCIFRGFPQFFRLCWLAGWCLRSPVGWSGVGLLPLLLPGLALILLNIYFLALASAASRYYQGWAALSLIHIPVAEVLSS